MTRRSFREIIYKNEQRTGPETKKGKLYQGSAIIFTLEMRELSTRFEYRLDSKWLGKFCSLIFGTREPLQYIVDTMYKISQPKINQPETIN